MTRLAPRQQVVAERLARLDALTAGLRSDERRVGLRRTRRPDHGLARAVVAWAKGATLDSVLRETDVAPGDFVRNIRQLIDLVRQLSQVASEPGHPGGGRRWPWPRLRRGVVGADDPAGVGSAPEGPPAVVV